MNKSNCGLNIKNRNENSILLLLLLLLIVCFISIYSILDIKIQNSRFTLLVDGPGIFSPVAWSRKTLNIGKCT